ncbi:hypothetical protein [Embleya sp. MST-111070]|uniref:hypothetical protein n=1 Tax=Embleya sp. MST-111070 TaxID=3398231 RepID=UPI003F737EF4
MTAGRGKAVLRPGDWVTYDDGEHQVVALAGTSVRLRSTAGAESVVPASHLMAAPDFAVTGTEPLPAVEPSGLLATLPGPVREAAHEWERHMVEIETGLPPGSAPGTPPRPGYAPAVFTLMERMASTARELDVTVRTMQSRRSRFVRQGVWGLVDQRAIQTWEATGRADARLVAVVQEALDAETHISTGTRSRLIRRVIKLVEATHGEGAVPLPSQRTPYKLIDALSTGRHTFDSAVTRRQTANRPQGPFTPTFADRPGEQVQIDSTPLDVMVVLDSGLTARADLTIAVDVDHPAVDLTRLPEVVDAQRKHLRILSRYGWAATYDAVLSGLMLCAHIWSVDGRPSEFGTWDRWEDRIELLIPFSREKQDYTGYSTSRLFAAIYPEAVALAPLIASRHWRQLADGTETDQARFLTEIGKRVTYPYFPPDHDGDAIAHWSLADSWRPPSRPLTTYTPGRVHGTLPGLSANRLARHEKSAIWFGRSQRDHGRTLLFHSHLKSVLLRDRKPQYAKWKETVWHSTRTDDLMRQEVARKRQAPDCVGSDGKPLSAGLESGR